MSTSDNTELLRQVIEIARQDEEFRQALLAELAALDAGAAPALGAGGGVQASAAEGSGDVDPEDLTIGRGKM
jgi:hypothetical protein